MTDVNVNRAIKDLTFREAMSELDTIVAALESNTLELEESLNRYERGVTLLASLQKRLDEAQQKVDVLMGQLEQASDDTATDMALS